MYLCWFRNHHFTAPKNITTKPEGILQPTGRKFTKFTQHHVNEGGGAPEEEARYNLATRVMSNGVEVIVADGKSTLPGEPNFFRILTNSKNFNRPLTLAPSTLNNVIMLMTLGGKNPKIDNIPDNSILNRFVTKTCLTTYTYLTTFTHNGSTMIESREKVISNIATEERNMQNLTPLIASDMTFFKTPNLKVGQFSTTYTYYNTIMDQDVPIVATSKHIVVNTITAADDYLKMIQPSLSALPDYETNTYYSTVEFSKTLSDDDVTKVINTQDVITQVIVTESLPHGRQPLSLNNVLIDHSEEDALSPSDYDDEQETHSYIKKTHAIDVSPTRIDKKPGNTVVPLHLYATKTYLTTFTYFTTLMQNAPGNSGVLSTVDSHTRVIENVITESIASSMVPKNILSSISKNLFDGEKNDFKTRIVLKNGQKLEITAANILKPVDYATATNVLSVESNDLDAAGNELAPASVLLTPQETENFVLESIESEETIAAQQQPIKLQSNNPRPKPVSSSPGSGSLKIPSLLNSISMPSFSALGPVINAMAGLLQNNFGQQTVTRIQAPPALVQSPLIRRPVDHESLPQALPLFSQESQDMILSQTDGKNTHPLYIPVRGDQQQNTGESHHQLHHVHNNHHHLMGSGIAISPGDVITANSDVIVGKPAVIGPNLPPHVKSKPVEAPPPFVPLKSPQRPQSFVKDIKSNGNINYVSIKKGDDYIGPVPPKDIKISGQQNRPIPLNAFTRQPTLQKMQKVQTIIPPMMRPNDNFGQHQNENMPPFQRPVENGAFKFSTNENLYQHQRLQNNFMQKPTPTQESQIKNQYVRINHHQGNIGTRNQQRINLRNPNENYRETINHGNQNQNQNPFTDQQPQKESYGHHHHTPQRPQFNENTKNNFFDPHQNHHNNLNAHINNQPLNPQANIIEIQKIPEVFQTDLPIITIDNYNRFRPNSDSQIITHELPEILEKPTKGQPLLVDIQPSQVANVVIPHGSSSILVFGGVHKAHKVGQYFNDPSPHGDGEVGIKSVNLLADVDGTRHSGQTHKNQLGNQNYGQHVHYDVKDNIIVASENIQVPIQSSPGFNVLIKSNIHPTISRPPHDFINHSVNVVPNKVIRFQADSVENFNQPTKQQQEQQIQIDQQLKQKEIENQKRLEYYQTAVENQKKLESELKQRKQFEEQQHLKQIEMDRKREYERRRQFEYEQLQKQIQNQRKEEEQQQQLKRLHEQNLKVQYEKQQKIQHDSEINQQFEHHQEHQHNSQFKQQQQQKLNFNVRPLSGIIPTQNSTSENSGFIILSSNYGSKTTQQGPFVPLPSQNTTSFQDKDLENESDSDGQVVQESINRPKLPSGQSHESLDEEDVKIEEEYDNFVYHKIAALSTASTNEDFASTTERFTTTEPTTSMRKLSTTATTSTSRRTSFVPTDRFYPTTTERTKPSFVPKPYPNLQFDNLPNSVNDLQLSHRPYHNKNHRVTNSGSHFKQNYNVQQGTTLSQAMKPPAPPKSLRRPTMPFRTTFKISMPINPMPDDSNVSNNLQTEEPFNPLYTLDFSTKPSFTTRATKGTEKTVEKVEETTSSYPSTLRNDLNIGEIEHESQNKTATPNDSLDIFDSKETSNPLNHGFIKSQIDIDDMDLIPPTIRKPYQTIIRIPETTTFKSTGIKIEISTTDLETMKPPAQGSGSQRTKAPLFEEIVNLKPPTSPFNGPNLNGKQSYVNIQRPTFSTNTFSTTVPSHVKSTISSNRPAYNNHVKTIKNPIHVDETFDVVLQYKQGDKKDKTNSSNDINIIGSVEAIDNVLGVKSAINATPVLNTSNLNLISTTPTLRSPVSISSSIRQHSSFTSSKIPLPLNKENFNFNHNRTKTFPEAIKVSTKYITNTKTITLAKTKTEVINRSHGVPITSTRVQTETVFETITETETLLKPTIITSINPTSTIHSRTVEKTPTATFPSTTEEIVEGFVSNEDVEEFIINYDENRNDSTIIRANNGENPMNPNEHESIFVVMTDKKEGSTFNIDQSIISQPKYSNTIPNEIDDISRGEEESNDGADHILLGGILIASPPQLDKSQQGATISGMCMPECKSSKNEYCHRVLNQMRCVCRPGFARMFPDRPCKPIYTYIMKIGLSRNGKERLAFDEALANKSSPGYTTLNKITHDGVDRMLMQSDLRDIYHSVDIIGFNSSKTTNNGVIGKMFVQLSENTNEKKLKETVKKYLRLSNYNLGGTDLYANPLTSELETYDFDECSGDDKSHDCSDHSHCFNLLGTYTCSCMEGFTDESENPIYPGRICVPELTGCEKCHYHGTCMTKFNEQISCECFQWYAGQSCQVNLKLLLFGLVVIGTTLFMLMMICLIITCVKKKRINQNAIAPTMSIIQRRISGSAHQSVSSQADRKAMIQDTSSEVSEESEPVPYFRKKSKDENIRKLSVEVAAPKKRKSTTNNPLGSFSKATMDQRDRSLTVMIPRAKYHHHQQKQGNLIDIEGYKSKSSSNTSVNQTKLINYLDSSPSSSKTKNVPSEKSNYHQQSQNPGALVSAGFKVSAAGGNGSPVDENLKKSRLSKTTSQQNVNETGNKYFAVHKISTMSEQPLKLHIDEKSQINLVRKSYSHGNLIDPMDDWLEHGTNAELAMSEARSYDETTIQAPTKALRNIYFKQTTHTHNEEMNTMAERDLGSTVLLPHTHLYKPSTDRGSDISGFDSL